MNRLFDTHHFRQSRQAAPVWNMTPLCADRPAQPVKVCVPGTWESIPGMGNYRGKCLYEQKFDGCGNMRFYFEGVSFRARVLVDGKELATHYGAYTGFDAIAPELESGTHLLQVEADNSWGDDSALHIPNDYYSYGGITRPVLIENIGDAYLTALHITTEKTAEGWLAHVEVTAQSLLDTDANYAITLKIDGITANKIPQPLPLYLPARQQVTLRHTIHCCDVTPWTPSAPHLYPVKAHLSNGSAVIDDLIERFGFREIRLQGQHILLNGEKLMLKGFNRHEDWGAFGCSIPLAAMVQDLKLMQDMGCNCVRTCHYPNDPLFLDLCDEMGMLVWEESHARGLNEKHMLHPRFMEQNLLCTREMVAQHYNHPSIFIWGCLNECADDTEYGADCYRKTYQLLHELDQSRPMTAALLERKGGKVYGDSDVVSINLYPLWYYEGNVKQQLDQKLAEIDATGGSGKPFIVSEIGAGAIFGNHDPLNESKWSEERQCTILKAQIEAVLSHPRCSGIFLWQFADCRVCEETFYGRPRTYNNKGVVNEYRQPKLAYKTVKDLFRK